MKKAKKTISKAMIENAEYGLTEMKNGTNEIFRLVKQLDIDNK